MLFRDLETQGNRNRFGAGEVVLWGLDHIRKVPTIAGVRVWGMTMQIGFLFRVKWIISSDLAFVLN